MRKLISIATVYLFSIAIQAAELKAYDKASFDAAVSAGQPVVVQIHADWCPTCKKQDAALKEILTPSAFKQVTLFKADFDKESELKKQLKVTKQSTLVLFKGGKELVQSRGVTDKLELQKLLTTHLGN